MLVDGSPLLLKQLACEWTTSIRLYREEVGVCICLRPIKETVTVTTAPNNIITCRRVNQLLGPDWSIACDGVQVSTVMLLP